MSILRNKMHALHEAQQRFTVMKRNVIEEKILKAILPRGFEAVSCSETKSFYSSVCLANILFRSIPKIPSPPT